VSLYLLTPGVRHYAWGDPSFIPTLLGRENHEQAPYAELWMGAHPELPSRVGSVPLNELIAVAPEKHLGKRDSERFEGKLPFLFKVLSAAAPLSIQAHPTEDQAREGFARENAAGVPLSARNRSYRDAHGKPELIVALTDFYALEGFRPLGEITEVLGEIPELIRFASKFEPTPGSLQSLYRELMSLPQPEVDAIISPIVSRLKGRELDRSHRGFWVLRADEMFQKNGLHDRGILSMFLLNLVHLRPGEGLYLGSGTLHAYLEGSGIEVMASSDNVLRGGLTEKHVDVPELLGTIVFEGIQPRVLEPIVVSDQERVYETPAREFELAMLEISTEKEYRNSAGESASILLVLETDGDVVITSEASKLTLTKGQSLYVPFGTPFSLLGKARICRASIPRETPRFRGRHPAELRFGTSGLRGLVEVMTDLEAYVNTRGFLGFLLERRRIYRGDRVALAGDLRPSTERLLRAVSRAVLDAGLRVDHVGRIPTPALTLYGIEHAIASIMVTGSHIPFDRNGIKFVKPSGEVLKEDEADILAAVRRMRSVEYRRPFGESPFLDDGSFKKTAASKLPPVVVSASESYVRRYLDFFPSGGLSGKRILVYQHSAVGRDLLVEILEGLGAAVTPVGRSDTFVPIDTEDISEARLSELQRMAEAAGGEIDAIVSTDGDSDRPLVSAIDSQGRVRFFAGDLLGILVADYLGADRIVVPISANDAVDRWFEAKGIHPVKTRIGSPFVISGMRAIPTGRIVGWEANGGFLTGSEFESQDNRLEALPTRDAVLPIVSVLLSAADNGCSLVDLFARLPARYGKAGLVDPFPPEAGQALIRGCDEPLLSSVFTPELGFDEIVDINRLDGVRIFFRNGDIAHIRPSGNAPQLRIYAVSDSQERADEIVAVALREPDGILRKLEKASEH
jgi:phosphomannomutase